METEEQWISCIIRNVGGYVRTGGAVQGGGRRVTQRQENTSHTSPFGLPAQIPFLSKFTRVVPFFLFLNRSTASSPSFSPPSLPAFSPCSFISSREMLKWANVRTIWSIRSRGSAKHTLIVTNGRQGTRHRPKTPVGLLSMFIQCSKASCPPQS